MSKRANRAGLPSFIVLVLALCSSPLAAQPARRGTRGGGGGQRLNASRIAFDAGRGAKGIPFELYANVIFASVRVNGSGPLWFIFDTGAGINVLNAERAGRLQLAGAGGGVTAKGTGGSVAGRLALGTTIRLPGVAVSGQRIAVLPLQSLEPRIGRRVDGILGYDFIREFVVEIDYERKLIALYDPASYRARGRDAVVPIQLRGGTPFVNATVELSKTERVAGEFEIDTGSDGALGLYDYFARAHDLRRRLPRLGARQTGAGVGGETSSVEARVRSFRLGRYAIENPVVSISEDDNEGGGRPKYDGMIGTEVFRRFRFVIDYARRRLLLEPNRFFREPYETDMGGLEFVAEGEEFRRFRVTGVAEGSPAAEAGVREGDLIEEIDGRAASGFTLDEIAGLLRRAGREYRLKLRRGDETVRATLRTRRMI